MNTRLTPNLLVQGFRTLDKNRAVASPTLHPISYFLLSNPCSGDLFARLLP